jgi:hypothetical protein
MELSGSTIELLYHEKILLYRELQNMLDQERESIIGIDVDALWKISDQKNKTVQKISDVNRRMLMLLDDLSISHEMDITSFDASRVFNLMPTSVKKKLHKAYVTLMALKSEIRARLEENKRYVEEYLSIFDEMIDLITHTEDSKPVYDRCRYPAKPSTPLFLNREV